MKRLLATLLLCGAVNAARAEGTTGASSLTLAQGARGQGMGDAFTAVAAGADAIYWNPAGLSAGPARSLIAGLQPLAEDTSMSQAALSARFGRLAVGLGYNAVSVSNLDALDTAGNKTGSFEAKDQTFTGALSIGGPALSFGAAGKMWKSTIDGVSADAVMADVGMAFQNPFLQRLRHGFILRNLGGGVTYVSQKDPLPTTAVFGTSLLCGRRLLLSGDYGVERDAGGFLAGGAEWRAATRERFEFALRGGYNTRRRDVGSLGGVTAGAGLSWRSVSVDYAWIPFGDIGTSHAVTLRFEFEASQARTPVKEKKEVKSKIEEPTQPPPSDRTPIRRRLSNFDQPNRR